MSRRPVLALSSTAVALALALTAGACGSSTTTTSSSATSTTLSPTTTAAPTPPSTSAGGATSITNGPVPAVTGGTDLTKEPTVAAGTGAPPAVLTDQDLVAGAGAQAAAADTVKVQYVGALFTTGQVFDASWTDSGPTSFALSRVIPGFGDAIVGMKVGGRREVVIPPALGYGASGQAKIPPNSTLVFVIDLLGIQAG